MAIEADKLELQEVQQLLITLSTNPSQRDLQRFKRLVEPAFEAQQARKIHPFYKSKIELEDYSKGDYQLAQLISADVLTPYLLAKEKTINESCVWAFLGMSGGGKSYMALLTILEWIRLGGRVIVFDPEGKDFKQLLHYVLDALYLRAKEDDLDPMITNSSLPDKYEWNKLFWSGIGASTMMGASTTVGVEICEQMLKQGIMPTIPNALKEIRKIKKGAFGLERNHVMSVESRLVALSSQGGLGPITKCVEGYPMKELEKFPLIVYDISRLEENDAFLYTLIKMMQQFYWAREDGLGNGKPLLIVIDEAHYMYGKARNSNYMTLTPPQIDIIKRARKANIKFLLCTPNPADLAPQVLNTSLIAVFRLDSYQDQKAVQSPLGLRDEELQILSELPPRIAIARM